MNIFLSSDNPRWTAHSEADLQSAIDSGLLEETHWMDLKREINPGRSANRELARDLASFALDGGTLLVGIEETASGLTLVPQELDGLAGRIEAVARSLPDPPLNVVCRTIPSAAETSKGYLVVAVPPSGQAPHMVDHRYIGRGHEQKQYLSDAEVLRLHQRRRSVEVDLLELLDKEVARDPVPNDQSHLFLLAEPLPGREGMLMDLVGKEGWQERLVKLQHEAVQRTQSTPRFSPDLTEASRQHRRPSGAALSSYRLRGDRQLSSESSSESVIDLEFSEDGGMRLYCSRLSDTLKDQRVLFDAGALTLTCQFIALLAAVTAEAGYLGMWGLGVRANNLAGLRSYENLKGMWGDGPAYSEDNYHRTAMANYADLSESPGRVADALLGRFLRALGTNETHQETLEKFGK